MGLSHLISLIMEYLTIRTEGGNRSVPPTIMHLWIGVGQFRVWPLPPSAGYIVRMRFSYLNWYGDRKLIKSERPVSRRWFLLFCMLKSGPAELLRKKKDSQPDVAR